MSSRTAWLAELARHAEWADARVWAAVLAAPDAASDDRTLGWLYHVHVVQHGFLAVWRGERFRPAKREAFAAPAVLAAWGRQAHAGIRTFVDGLAGADLDRTLRVPWAGLVEKALGRPVADTALGHTVLQVAVHSAHHRGQLCARLRELGAEPPTTDLIAWFWVEKPAAEWPAAAEAPATAS